MGYTVIDCKEHEMKTLNKELLQAMTHFSSNDVGKAGHQLICNILHILFLAELAKIFWATISLKELARVNAQDTGDLVNHVRGRKGVSSFDAVDIVVPFVQVNGQILLG